MINNNRTLSNLAMLELIARKLGKLKDKFVFLGGCTTALFITDSASPDVRHTHDVDCIVDVISLSHYYRIEKQLHQQGFKKSLEDAVICRWRCDNIILDVMPTDEKILGFSNRWFKAAAEHAFIYQITKDLSIRSVTAPYFLATKLEAFKHRGGNDMLSSPDFEDVVTVIDGRAEIVDEIMLADTALRKALAKAFTNILQDKQYYSALFGHLNYGPVTKDRAQIVLNRMEKIAKA